MLLTKVAPETVTPVTETLSVATTVNVIELELFWVVNTTLLTLLLNELIVGACVSVLEIETLTESLDVFPAGSVTVTLTVSLWLPNEYDP